MPNLPPERIAEHERMPLPEFLRFYAGTLRDHGWTNDAVFLRVRAEQAEVLTKERDDAAARVAELEKSLAREWREAEKLVVERDAYENAISDAYTAVTGQELEWSNHFGAKEAIGEMSDEVNALREQVRTLTVELEAAREIQAKHPSVQSMLRDTREELARVRTAHGISRAALETATAEAAKLRELAAASPVWTDAESNMIRTERDQLRESNRLLAAAVEEAVWSLKAVADESETPRSLAKKFWQDQTNKLAAIRERAVTVTAINTETGQPEEVLIVRPSNFGPSDICTNVMHDELDCAASDLPRDKWCEQCRAGKQEGGNV